MCVENGGEVTVRWGEALCWEVRQKVPEGQGVCGVFNIPTCGPAPSPSLACRMSAPLKPSTLP